MRISRIQIGNFRNFAEVDIQLRDKDFWDGLTELEDGASRPLDRGNWIGASLKYETEVAA